MMKLMNKKRNSWLAMLAMILCTSVIILPALAGSFTLKIYGNANLDSVIDEKDVDYIRAIMAGSEPKTIFSDTNLDGVIDETDIMLTEKIVNDTMESLTIIDSANRTVTVMYPIDDLVSLNQNSAQALKILDAEGRIIGVEKNVADKPTSYPDLFKLPVVKSGSTADYEKILSLDPDVAIAYPPSADENSKSLSPKVTVIGLGFFEPKKMDQEFAQLGYLMGKRDEAYEFINFYKTYIDTITERIKDLPKEKRVRAYLEQSSKEYVASGNGSGTNDMCAMAGGINIAVNLVGAYPTVDPEWVIVENPDVITKTANHGNMYMGYERDDTTNASELRASIMNRTGLENVKAVQDGRVFIISDSIATNPSFFVGVTYLAKIFYPDLFTDLNPKSIHQEYLTHFQKLDYDLDQHGLFTYPEPA
jgi:iron complex transport system substrate-binding protein